ncbi:MAG: MBL fold metallo-hydrolase [Devosiaceae bacterium]|nr:MBL fold metallo-hydrolase [Devosiaceae bacterium]
MTNPAQQIVATILGSGSSGGVPRVGNIWGDCDPNEPKNRRRRCSLLLTGTTKGRAGKTRIIIDTGCDLREQLLDANVKNIDAVFYTHEHADHTHGIDDLRAIALNNRKRIDIYMGERTRLRLHKAFSYCFEAPKDSGYPPILNSHEILASKSITITGEGGDITLLPVLQEHGNISTFGFRIDDFLYSCDVSGFADKSISHLASLKVWIVDALRRSPHPSHLNLEQSLAWIKRIKPNQAILTNLHVDLDYKTIIDETPDNVTPAYDGMRIDINTGKILS